jgi:hypothetical protein
MSKWYFNPGCALSIYKPEMEKKILQLLQEHLGEVDLHNICCQHDPQLPADSLIINICAGCDKRFSTLYQGITTISIWEIIDGIKEFPLPVYEGLRLSVHDACPIRGKPQIHQAVRSILGKMNVAVMEAKFSGIHSICCGDSFYNKLPLEKVHQLMESRAVSMPCDEVCVYCVSCVKAMHIGGKSPRHLMDLIMDEPTDPQTFDTVLRHEQLQEYIKEH